MGLPLYASYLRTYTPLDAFPPEEAEHWRRYVAAGRAPHPCAAVQAEHAAGLAALPRASLTVPGDDALVQVVGATTYVCPLRTQLRAWEAAVAFGAGLPGPTADLLRPREQAERAAAELARWQAAHPHLRSHVLVCPWTVPTAWFVLFAPEEQLRQDGSVRYLTDVARARQRGVTALAVLAETLPQAPATLTLGRTVDWLTGFPGEARLELDYATLVQLLGAAAVASDTSVADVTEALTCLAASDPARAARAYERLMARWRPLQQREHAS